MRLDCDSAQTESDALSDDLKTKVKKLVENEVDWRQRVKSFQKRQQILW